MWQACAETCGQHPRPAVSQHLSCLKIKETAKSGLDLESEAIMLHVPQ